MSMVNAMNDSSCGTCLDIASALKSRRTLLNALGKSILTSSFSLLVFSACIVGLWLMHQMKYRTLNSGFDQQTRRHLSFCNRITGQLVTARFQLWRHTSRTVCHPSYCHLHHCQHSSVDWRQSFPHAHTCHLMLNRFFKLVASNLGSCAIGARPMRLRCLVFVIHASKCAHHFLTPSTDTCNNSWRCDHTLQKTRLVSTTPISGVGIVKVFTPKGPGVT